MTPDCRDETSPPDCIRATGLRRRIAMLWQAIRRLSGDDAYERYLAHLAEKHPGQTPLSRRDFYKQYHDGQWQGIRRCC